MLPSALGAIPAGGSWTLAGLRAYWRKLSPLQPAQASSLLAMVLVSKLLLHQLLNPQSDTYAREGIEIDTSTLAD